MANFEALNSTNYFIPIEALNVAGASVPFPSNDTFTATNDNTSLDSGLFSIGTMPGSNPPVPALVINSAGHPLTSNAETVTVSDSAGLTGVTLAVDVVADTTPVELDLNVSAAVAQVPPA